MRQPHLARLGLVALLLVGSLPLLTPDLADTSAQSTDPACATSGPEGGEFEVEVCLTVAGAGEAIEGDTEVTATVELANGALPLTGQVEFALARSGSTGDRNILTDYLAPYTFTLPTERYEDGGYRIIATAEFYETTGSPDRFDAESVEVDVNFENGVETAPESNDTWEPSPGRPGSPFVVAVTGDGAGGLPEAEAVGDLIDGWDPNLLLYLGDVYQSGTYVEFYNYYEPTLGQLRSITNPVPGNHESGSGFRGYFDYWNTYSHYYSVEAAGWRLIALDNTREYGQLEPGSPQYDWLAEELAANANECTIVFMHFPRWGLSRQSDYEPHDAIWQLLADNGVELALAGHEHNYQRWQPLDGAGQVSPTGVTQLVVGTGGHDLESFGLDDARLAGGAEKVDGALRLELAVTGASFQFVASDGAVLDTGSLPCDVPGYMTLSQTKSKTEGKVEAGLSNFTPGSEITLRWEDGAVLGRARADDAGSAVTSFRTPATPYGSYEVTAEDENGLTGTATLRVIPRVKITRTSIEAGANLRVYLYGFSAGEMVDLRFTSEGGATFDVLDSFTVDANGRGSTVVTIPATASPGEHSLVAVPLSSESGSASETIEVTTADADASPVSDG